MKFLGIKPSIYGIIYEKTGMEHWEKIVQKLVFQIPSTIPINTQSWMIIVVYIYDGDQQKIQ